MNSRSGQRGLSLIGLLAVIIIVGLIGLVVIRLFPVYYESFIVSSIFHDMKTELTDTSADGIRNSLQRRFNVNEIDAIKAGDVTITSEEKGAKKVSVHYEDRVPFVGNLALVATFDKSVEVPDH